MLEKRKFVRFKVPFHIQFKRDNQINQPQGIVKDISMGGLRVVVDEFLDYSTDYLVCFYLFLPGKTFKLYGKITWMRGYNDKKEAGIQFARIPDTYKQDIQEHISKYHLSELTHKWWAM